MGILVSCPAYYSVSAAKAELLNKIKDMPEAEPEEEEQEDVNEKKVEWTCSAVSPKVVKVLCKGHGYQPLRQGANLSHLMACESSQRSPVSGRDR